MRAPSGAVVYGYASERTASGLQVIRGGGKRRDRSESILRYAEFDAPVPIDHWQAGRKIIPSLATARARRLADYLDMYNGEWGRWMRDDDFIVRSNFFRGIANNWAQMNMAFPPEFSIGGTVLRETGLIPEMVVRNLVKATRQNAEDYMRYGVGGFLVEPTNNAVSFVSPLFWYPDDTGEAEALVWRSGFTAQGEGAKPYQLNVWKLLPDGVIEHEAFRQSGDRFEETIGTPVALPEIEGGWGVRPGEGDVWDAIQEVDGGKRTALTTVQRSPEVGEWGTSLYEELAPHIFDLATRYSSRSIALDKFGNPKLLLENAVSTEGTAMRRLANDERAQFLTVNDRHGEEFEQDLVLFSSDIAGATPLTWDFADHAIEAAIDDDLKAIFAVSPVPAHYYDAARFAPPSGRALEVLNSRTFNAMADYRTSAIPKLRRVFAQILAAYGYSASQIRVTVQRLDIEWTNPIERAASMEVSVQTDDGVENEGDADAAAEADNADADADASANSQGA